MAFKVFAALFVSLLAVHAANQTPIVGDGREMVLFILNYILQTTNSALQTAHYIVDAIEKDQVQVTADIIAFVVKEGKSLNADLLDLIDSLRAGATEDGNAVIDCIDDERNKTEEAFAEVSTIIGHCAANEITVILNQFRAILGQLDDLQADVLSQGEALTVCSKDELTCLITFFGEILAITKKIPDDVKQDIDKVIELVETIIKDFSTCDISTTIEARAKEIFNEAVICIKG